MSNDTTSPSTRTMSSVSLAHDVGDAAGGETGTFRAYCDMLCRRMPLEMLSE